AALELFAPAFDEFALVVENHHAVGPFTGRVHGVMDIDMPVRILADSMRVAVLNVGGEFAPVMCHLVGVFALSQDRLLTARFIGSSQDERSGESSQKRTARC